MMDDKNIDRLFQEKLRDFEAKPNPKVWSKIESKLQKKKRRILPVWWFTGTSIAALFIIGLLIYPFKKEQEPILHNNTIIITKTEENKSSDTTTLILKNSDKNILKKKKTNVKNNNIIIRTASLDKKRDEFTNQKEKAFAGVLKDVSVTTKITKKREIFLKKELKDTISNIKNNTKKTLVKKDFIAEKLEEEENNDKTKINKWSVTPTIAALQANSFSKVSAIDASLNNNELSEKITYGYGINVSYQINKKWSIQTGVHLQEVQFNTNNITVVKSTVLNSNLSNIVYATDEIYISNGEQSDIISSFKGYTVTNQATINQKYGYIEIPIEIKYNLIQIGKFRTNIIAGLSSLFLNKNTIEISSSNFSDTLGKATNLNDVNFSGNLGIDFNYSIKNNLGVAITPMFKTQMSTFSKNANGFKPYTIGIYAGLKYDF